MHTHMHSLHTHTYIHIHIHICSQVDARLSKRREDLRQSLAVTEERASDLERYTDTLMGVIDGLRERRRDHLRQVLCPNTPILD